MVFHPVPVVERIEPNLGVRFEEGFGNGDCRRGNDGLALPYGISPAPLPSSIPYFPVASKFPMALLLSSASKFGGHYLVCIIAFQYLHVTTCRLVLIQLWSVLS